MISRKSTQNFSSLLFGIAHDLVSLRMLSSLPDSEEFWFRVIQSVILQFDWLCDVCGYMMSPTLGIYWVELGFINNYKEPQLWLVLLRYNADVANAFPWVVTYGIRASPVIPYGLRDTTPQSGP